MGASIEQRWRGFRRLAAASALALACFAAFRHADGVSTERSESEPAPASDAHLTSRSPAQERAVLRAGAGVSAGVVHAARPRSTPSLPQARQLLAVALERAAQPCAASERVPDCARPASSARFERYRPRSDCADPDGLS